MKVDTRTAIELFGLTSIVASLVFVGIQLEQDRTVALGAQYNSRATLNIETRYTRFENDAYIEDVAKRWDLGPLPGWWNKDIQNYKDRNQVSTEGMVRLFIISASSAIELDNNYYQYRLGLIQEEDWAAIRETYKQALSGSALARAATTFLTGLSPETQLLNSEILAELKSEG